jgi:uncharacterized membrane protein
MVNDIELARALHVLSVVHWIGGVAFVTLVVLPTALREPDAARGWAAFEAFERGFAAQVRYSIALAGVTGLWMAWRLDLSARFADPSSWPLAAMAALWLVFMAIVFVVEPLAEHRLAAAAARDPASVLRRLTLAHAVLLALAAVTIFGAVAES